MYERTKRFASKFPKQYEVVKELPPSGGSSITKVSVDPALVFEMLEVVFGPYEDLYKDFKFVDDKVTWHRYFNTPVGILSVYDWKGGNISIGGVGEMTAELKQEANEFKEALEKNALVYPKIRKQDLKDEIKTDPLRNFLRTFLATYNLLSKARETGSLLEALVLYASTVDAHLRYGIIFSRQLREKTSNYQADLIFQTKTSYISERDIHKLALEEEFISKKQFEEISRLYEFRNRAVHRYFISDFEYIELPKRLDRFERIRESIANKIIKLEQRQVKKKIGMTTAEDIKVDHRSRRIVASQEHLKIDSNLNVAVVPKRNHMFPREYGPRTDTKEVEE